jgi:Tol biopolymer transport system component
MGSLVSGTAVDVLGKAAMDDGDWYQIEYPPNSGDMAWITGNPSLVKVSGEADVPSIAQNRLPTPPPTTAAPARPATLPGEIYYSSTTSRGVDNIYRVPAAGGSAELVVEQGRQPDLTADGTQLAYQSTSGNALGIRSLSLGSNRSTLYSGSPEDSLPSWRPGGGTLIYASNREGDRAYRLYVTSGGGNEVQLGRGTEPDWNPTRDLIVYRGCDNTGGRCGLWTMQSDGTNKQQLTDDSSDSRPRWSADGRSVVFMSRNRDTNWEIYSVDVASGDVTRLTDNPNNDGLPVYSPDGQSIAFLTNRGGGTWEIYAMDTQGNNLQSVTRLDSALPDWLSEGLDWTQ